MNIAQIIAAGMEITATGNYYATVYLHLDVMADCRDALNYARWHNTGNWRYEILGGSGKGLVTAYYCPCGFTTQLLIFIPLAHFEAWLREGE